MNLNETMTAGLETSHEGPATDAEQKALVRGHRLPHPLNRFAVRKEVKECGEAQMIVEAIKATVLEKRGTSRWRFARWFLFESTMLFEICAIAGIDGGRLRRHLGRAVRVEEEESGGRVLQRLKPI